MTTRERLYDLVDGLPDDKLDEAEALLEQIAPGRNGRRVMRLEDAPDEDEALSEAEKAALERLDRGISDPRSYTREEIQQLLDDNHS
ncbi:MAG: hypothetical protein R3C29_11565 [Dehalococcoidia bacterium]